MYNFNKEQFELLHSLLIKRTYSGTKEEDEFINYLQEWITENVQNVEFEKDKFGNLYVTKGDSTLYPCIVSHVDINQDEVKNVSIIWNKDYIFGMNDNEIIQCGLGFDDKCGVMLALICLQKYNNIKCFFSKSEEIGCRGTKQANMKFFQDCSFLIQGDRNSFNRDISEYTNGVKVISDEFKKASKNIVNQFNYKYQNCVYTDIGELCKQNAGCCAYNFSIGYYNEHTNGEVMIVSEFEDAVNFTFAMIDNLSYKRWLHTPDREYTNYFFDDWYEQDVYSKYKPNTWHYCEHFKFEKQDEEYIQDSLEVGQCPCCNSTNITCGDSFEDICLDCNSVFNIPSEKRLEEVILLNESEIDTTW
jgi:hypothetical protein